MLDQLFHNGFKRADCHVHTNYTDGNNSVFEYCEKAIDNGIDLIVFSEHVRRNLLYDYDKLINDINEARSYFKNLTLLSGCEAKVLNLNGDLDIPNNIVHSCDMVTGVFHSFSYSDKKSYIEALISMLKNPIVDIWGHPTLFAQKNNIDLNVDDLYSILSTCIDNNILIEINLKYCLPSEEFMKIALNCDVKFVIGSDAHSIEEMINIEKIEVIHNWLNKIY